MDHKVQVSRLMLNVYVTDDEAGFFTAMQAHLFAKHWKAGIIVNYIRQDEVDVKAKKLLTALRMASATRCSLPDERHIVFAGLSPSEPSLRALDEFAKTDVSLYIHVIGSSKISFQTFYSRLGSIERDDLLLLMLELLSPDQR